MKVWNIVFSIIIIFTLFLPSWGWTPSSGIKKGFHVSFLPSSLNRAAAAALLGITLATTAVPPLALADLSPQDVLLIKELQSDIREFKASTDNKFAAMDNKFAAMDNKFAAMDNKFAAMDNKLTAMDNKFVLVPIVSVGISAIATVYNANKLDDTLNRFKDEEKSIKKTLNEGIEKKASEQGFKGSIVGALSVVLLVMFLQASN